MTLLCCSRHQTTWNGDDVSLCPVCSDEINAGGKAAHMSPTPQEISDAKSFSPDTPRVNYARTCGTSALSVEACKLERELSEVKRSLSESQSEREEQARLLGMSGEREARLIAQLAAERTSANPSPPSTRSASTTASSSSQTSRARTSPLPRWGAATW